MCKNPAKDVASHGPYTMKVFISYHSPDRGSAERIARALEAAGIEPFLAPWSLQPGSFWLPALARAIQEAHSFVILLGKSGVGSWQLLEYYEALGRRVHDPDFSLVPVLAGVAPRLPFLYQLHCLEVEDLSEPDVAQPIVRAVRGDVAFSSRPWLATNPYRGLTALGETDAAFFFGRESATSNVLEQIRTGHRFVMLVGPSGVGKSSIQHAGVTSALRRQTWPGDTKRDWPIELAGSHSWWFVTFEPQQDPLKSLVRQFVKLWTRPDDPTRTTDTATWIRALENTRDIGPLIDATRDVMSERFETQAPTKFAIVVDQWEQLYQRRKEDRVDPRVEAFSSLLASACACDDVVIVGSLRSDYYVQFQNDQAIFERAARVDVLPLSTGASLLPIISRPAEVLGVEFEPASTALDIAHDVEQMRGGLPILSYVLEGAWSRMQQGGDNVFRPSYYLAEGGVKGVLAKRLNAYIAKLEKRSLDALKTLFSWRLATAESGKPLSRRRALRSECGAEEWAHVEVLAGPEWRLLTTGEIDGRATVEVAHEDVLRVPSPIAEWIEQHRRILEWKTRLESERLFWEQLGSRPDNLLSQVRVDTYRRELGDDMSCLDEEERSFFEASIQTLAQEDQRRLAEKQAADRFAKAIRWLLRSAVAIGTFGTVLGVVWFAATRTDWYQLSMVRQSANQAAANAGEAPVLQWVAALARDHNLTSARAILGSYRYRSNDVPSSPAGRSTFAIDLAKELGGAGRLQDARSILADTLKHDESPSTKVTVALVLAGLGDHDHAIRTDRHARAWGEGGSIRAARDPLSRAEPRNA